MGLGQAAKLFSLLPLFSRVGNWKCCLEFWKASRKIRKLFSSKEAVLPTRSCDRRMRHNSARRGKTGHYYLQLCSVVLEEMSISFGEGSRLFQCHASHHLESKWQWRDQFHCGAGIFHKVYPVQCNYKCWCSFYGLEICNLPNNNRNLDGRWWMRRPPK